MTANDLFKQIQLKKSFLAVGLDTDIKKIPAFLLDSDEPIFEFNKAIIDATQDLCIAYKLNIAFYEAMGIPGWQALEKTIDYIPNEQLIIADAKRGDIGNTCDKYAEAFFKTLNVDAITLSPYMGEDSVKPFLQYEGKWAIVLSLTSNPSSTDFQQHTQDGEPLYIKVATKAAEWGNENQIMLVVGATHPENFKAIRAVSPKHFYLVPGVGAQGGDMAQVAHYGMNEQCGLIVNSSRSIIYAGSDANFASDARSAAQAYQSQMQAILIERGLV